MPSEPSSKDECDACGHAHEDVDTCGYSRKGGEWYCVCDKRHPKPEPEAIHKWKCCDQCRHPEHPSACEVCRCLAVTSAAEIAERCRSAGGCPKHPRPKPEPVLNDRFRHSYDTVDGPCSKPDCDCKAYAPVVIETVELPEAKCKHPAPYCYGGTFHADGGVRYWSCLACKAKWEEPLAEDPLAPPGAACAVLHQDAQGNAIPCPDDAPAEPEECGHPTPYCYGGNFHANGGRRYWQCLDCKAKWEEPITEDPLTAPPPQPAPRPPYAIAYSVEGQLYEASLPGDATVVAMDGVLIIEHHGRAVSGITQVLPVRQEK